MKKINSLTQEEIRKIVENPPVFTGVKSVQMIELIDEYTTIIGYALMAKKNRKDIGLMYNEKPLFVEDRWDAVKCHKALKSVN